MEQLKALWEKKPLRYSIYVAAAVVVFMVVAQLNDWLTGF